MRRFFLLNGSQWNAMPRHIDALHRIGAELCTVIANTAAGPDGGSTVGPRKRELEGVVWWEEAPQRQKVSVGHVSFML